IAAWPAASTSGTRAPRACRTVATWSRLTPSRTIALLRARPRGARAYRAFARTTVASTTMRLGAGRWKNARLPVAGAHVRPVPARLRTSLFSVLGPRVEGAHVLDLCAG